MDAGRSDEEYAIVNALSAKHFLIRRVVDNELFLGQILADVPEAWHQLLRRGAVRAAIDAGLRTKDMGGSTGTVEAGDAIVAELVKILKA